MLLSVIYVTFCDTGVNSLALVIPNSSACVIIMANSSKVFTKPRGEKADLAKEKCKPLINGKM